MIRTYDELRKLKTFKERFNYLQLKGKVGETTFGFDRYLNQELYHSNAWKDVRDLVIIRDEGCDLGISGYEIYDQIYVHHMNPITIEDFLKLRSDLLFDINGLICTSFRTHQAIHFGDVSLLPKLPIIRRPGDTTLW